MQIATNHRTYGLNSYLRRCNYITKPAARCIITLEFARRRYLTNTPDTTSAEKKCKRRWQKERDARNGCETTTIPRESCFARGNRIFVYAGNRARNRSMSPRRFIYFRNYEFEIIDSKFVVVRSYFDTCTGRFTNYQRFRERDEIAIQITSNEH